MEKIIKMVMEEVWKRNNKNPFSSLWKVMEEIHDNACMILVDDMIQKRSLPDD